MKKQIYIYILFLGFLGCSDSQAQPKLLDVNAFEKLIDNTKNLQLVDVRTPPEVAAGFIENAININFNDAEFKAKLEKLDKTKPVALYCAGGGRSGKASAVLVQMGFKTVYDLAGGMNGWVAKGKKIIGKN